MGKLEIKKEMKKKLEEVTDLNVSLNNSLESLVHNYIDYISKKVYKCCMKYFGVGITCRTDQFGDYYGFLNEKESNRNGYNTYTCVGQGWFVANNFNYHITGSTTEDLIDFAEKIPTFIEEGIKHLEDENEKIESIKNKLSEILKD